MDSFLDYAQHYKEGELIMWLDISTHCNAGCPQCHRTDVHGLGKADWLPLVQWSLDDFKKAFCQPHDYVASSCGGVGSVLRAAAAMHKFSTSAGGS